MVSRSTISFCVVAPGAAQRPDGGAASAVVRTTRRTWSSRAPAPPPDGLTTRPQPSAADSASTEPPKPQPLAAPKNENCGGKRMTTAPRAGTALNAVNEIVAVVSACARPSAKATEAAVSSLAPTATATLGMAGATLAFAPSSAARRSTVPRPTSSVRTPKGIVVCSAHGAVTSAKRTRSRDPPAIGAPPGGRVSRSSGRPSAARSCALTLRASESAPESSVPHGGASAAAAAAASPTTSTVAHAAAIGAGSVK